MEQRICTRCLLRDLAEADGAKKTELEMLQTYRNAIRQADRATEEEYERRLCVCKSCGKLVSGTCRACGCYVELRAFARASRCPHRKW